MNSNLLMSIVGSAASSAAVLLATMEAQQPQPGGTPSQQPGPSNPTPRPSSPGQNDPNQPGQQQPGQQQPGQQQPGQQQPGQQQPGQQQPGQQQPGQQTPIERRDNRTPLNRQPGGSTDNPRYISIADPSMEPRFRETAGRLVNIERSMAERNQGLIDRLATARTLPPERQSAAVLDLLQAILQENAQLHQYLSQSRTLLTGDINDSPNPAQPTTAPNQPGTTTPRNSPR